MVPKWDLFSPFCDRLKSASPGTADDGFPRFARNYRLISFAPIVGRYVGNDSLTRGRTKLAR